MDIGDILTLVKAGYTRHEIEQMDNQAPADPDPVPAGNPTPVPEPEKAPAPAPVAQPVAPAQPVPAPAPEPTQPTMAELMQSIAKLTSAVQANAIAQSVLPGGVNGQPTPTAEDMLAEIIRPTFKARE